MWKLLKEYLSVLILDLRSRTLTQCCYNAWGYAVEIAAQESRVVDIEDAVFYLEQKLPGVKVAEAKRELISMQAKLLGIGSQPGSKLQ